MKQLLLTVFILLCFGCTPKPKVTIYDDGKSCPFDCDPHVVMEQKLNGTKYAFDPESSPKKPKKCVLNGDCKICFDEKSTQCLITKYRGSGPPKNTFDLTAEFYEVWCSREHAPETIKTKCSLFKAKADAYKDHTNCIAQPDQTDCRDIMKSANNKKAEDMPNYKQCKKLGQEAYNIGKPDSKKRAHGCNYSYLSLGTNSSGKKWKLLMPAACPEGKFVGQHGLDCCSGYPLTDIAFGGECKKFYIDPKASTHNLK